MGSAPNSNTAHSTREQQFPDVPKALLDHLERMFPPRFPDLGWDDRKIWFEAGKTSLVQLLRHHFDKQTNVLK